MNNTIYAANGHQQSNDPNKNWKKIVLFILVIIAFCIIAGLHGCSPEKKLEREYNHVISDSGKVQKMRSLIERLYPCIPTEGKIGETKIETKVVIDTAATLALKHKNDSLFSIIKKGCPQLNIDSLKSIWEDENSYTIKDSLIYKTRVDTVPDTRAINLLNDKNAQLQHLNDLQVGQLIQSNAANKTLTNEISNWKWKFYGSWGGLLFIVLGFFAVKIASKNNPATVTASAGSNILTTIINKIKGK